MGMIENDGWKELYYRRTQCEEINAVLTSCNSVSGILPLTVSLAERRSSFCSQRLIESTEYWSLSVTADLTNCLSSTVWIKLAMGTLPEMISMPSACL